MHYRMHPVRVGLSTIYFRGIQILDTVIDALLMAGVNAADNVILTGCSGNNNLCYSYSYIMLIIIMYSWRVQHLRAR